MAKKKTTRSDQARRRASAIEWLEDLLVDDLDSYEIRVGARKTEDGDIVYAAELFIDGKPGMEGPSIGVSFDRALANLAEELQEEDRRLQADMEALGS